MSLGDITSGPDARFSNTTNWHRRYHDSWSWCQCPRAANHGSYSLDTSPSDAGQVERSARAIHEADSPVRRLAAGPDCYALYRRLAAAALSSLAGEERR